MLVWNQDLSVNVVEIDEQHRELFARINRFLEALEQKAGKKALEELFTFLEHYVVIHFNHEESIMDKYSFHEYADYGKHKQAHVGFKRDFAEFKADLIRENVSEQLITEFKSWIINWWLIHINKIDKNFGDYIRTVILF
jgi:hemerythrin